MRLLEEERASGVDEEVDRPHARGTLEPRLPERLSHLARDDLGDGLAAGLQEIPCSTDDSDALVELCVAPGLKRSLGIRGGDVDGVGAVGNLTEEFS